MRRDASVLGWGASRRALAAIVLVSLSRVFPVIAQVAPDSLIAHAVAEGYWAASLDSSAAGKVNRGSRFVLRRIEVHMDGGRALPGFSTIGFTGTAASQKNLEALRGALRTHLLNSGFPFAVVQSIFRVDSSGSTNVDLELQVSGDAFKLGGLQLLETRTKPDAALRLALLQPGEPFSRRRLELSVKRLRRTGYFESAALAGLFRDSTRNLIHPALRLPDLQGNRLSGLLGYDSKAGSGGQLTGYVDMHLINIFGTARDADFNFENRTGNEREVRALYVEPWLFGLPLGLRLEAEFLQQDTVFWEWNRGITFFQDLNFTNRLEAGFGDQENRDAISGLRSHAVKSGLRLIVDGRDRVPLTHSGYRIETGITGLRREIADSAYYLVQCAGSAESWIPLTSRFGARLGLRAASNFPLDRFNHGELYFVGGANSLRGYREREFQTNAYVLTQQELQASLGRKGRLFVFSDPGWVNRLTGRYSWRGVLGYGAGIELSKGDWSVSTVYALNPERGPGDGLLHVGVDNRF